MLYDESQERLGLEQDALCTVREVLEKVVTDYAILPAKPNMDEFRRAMLVFENHAVIQRIEGRYNQADCRFCHSADHSDRRFRGETARGGGCAEKGGERR